MTKDERIEHLDGLFRKFAFAYTQALDELRRRGMTDSEMLEFTNDINTDYAVKFEGEKLS